MSCMWVVVCKHEQRKNTNRKKGFCTYLIIQILMKILSKYIQAAAAIFDKLVNEGRGGRLNDNCEKWIVSKKWEQ